jgi:FkbM family methyltransferase
MALKTIACSFPGGTASFVMDDADGRDFIVGSLGTDLSKYEEPLPAMIGALALLTGEDFFDVGANTGLYALHYACLAPKAGVHAFEPLPEVADQLEKNIGLNPTLGPIRVARIALSDRAGSSTFYHTINPHGLLSASSSLEAAHAAWIGHKLNAIRVTTICLDDYVAGSSARPRIMKIDVEGHELKVLLGAGQTIARLRPLIFAEMLHNADFGALAAWLERNRYLTFALTPGAMAPLDPVCFVEPPNQLLCPLERQDLATRVAERAGLTVGRV